LRLKAVWSILFPLINNTQTPGGSLSTCTGLMAVRVTVSPLQIVVSFCTINLAGQEKGAIALSNEMDIGLCSFENAGFILTDVFLSKEGNVISPNELFALCKECT